MAVRLIEGRDYRTGRGLAITVENGRIATMAGCAVAANAAWIGPGLVDLQVNGYGGMDANGAEVTAETIVELGRALARVGTTTFVPTIITASETDISRSLRAIVAARRQDSDTRHAIPFVHVEGPHLSEQDGPRGAHPLEHVRPPDEAEFDRWQEACGGLVGIVTLSPHHRGSVHYTQHVTAAGVRVAIGHTHASAEQISAVVDAGACLSTHLGNGAHAVLDRHPNYIWTQLAEDRLLAGFIADGHHVPGDTLTAMIRAKGIERSFLVSDSVAVAGLPPGDYTMPVGGKVQLSSDGRLNVTGTPYLAGGARCLADCVVSAARSANLTMPQSFRLATELPGRVAGNRGLLRPGGSADLIVFDWLPEQGRMVPQEILRGGTDWR